MITSSSWLATLSRRTGEEHGADVVELVVVRLLLVVLVVFVLGGVEVVRVNDLEAVAPAGAVRGRPGLREIGAGFVGGGARRGGLGPVGARLRGRARGGGTRVLVTGVFGGHDRTPSAIRGKARLGVEYG
jgi:hypothetical protein